MIYSWIVVGIFFFSSTSSGFAEETVDHQISTKEALHTVGKFLREDGGTIWLSSLTAGRSAPLTTDQLMVEILNSTDANEEVKAAANVIKIALEEKRIAGSNDTGVLELEGWKDLVDNVEDQNDIICLYRKSLNVSSERTEDWQKFLKTMSAGYTVYLALDMGQKYVICLKKIQISEQNSSSGAKSLNSTEFPLKPENFTFDIIPSGSRSLNGKLDSAEESEEDEKCNDRNRIGNMNIRRQFMPLRPVHQESPCSRPIIYMLPFGFYNWPQSGNYPASRPLNPGLPMMNPANLAPGLPNTAYPMIKPAPLPSGLSNSEYLLRSAKPVPRLPSSGFPMMKSAAFTPRSPPISGYPKMRSATVPSRIPGPYQDLVSRKQLPDHSGEIQRSRQYPNHGPPNSNVLQAPIPTRGYFQPPRRFFQPSTQQPRIIQPFFQPGLTRLPDGPSVKPRGSPRSFPIPRNDFQPFNYGQNPSFYPIQSSFPNQYSNPSCKNYLPCVFPCDKPLLVKVQIEPSQNPLREFSNIAFIPQSGPTNPWRRNMDPESNIEIRKEEGDQDNKGVEVDNSIEKEENTSDSFERSESLSSEIAVSVAPANEGMD